MNRSISTRQVLKLYKTILRLHRGLPAEIRVLGDEYVKEEFRRHKNVHHDEKEIFVKEWMRYASDLTIQLGLRGPISGSKVGSHLRDQQLDAFRDDQLGQLYELMRNSTQAYVPNKRNGHNDGT